MQQHSKTKKSQYPDTKNLGSLGLRHGENKLQTIYEKEKQINIIKLGKFLKD